MRSERFRALLTHFPDYIHSVLRRDERNKNFYQCPFCGSGTHGTHSTGALAVDFTKKTWFCHACGESGGMLQLCMKLEHLPDTKEAFRHLCNMYIGENTELAAPPFSPAPQVEQTEEAQDTPEATDYTSYFRTCCGNMHKGGYQYLASRGIPARLADRFRIGFDPRWEHPKNVTREKHYYTPRLIIPLGKYAYLARDTRPKQKQEYSKLKCGQLRDYFFGNGAINNPLCFFVVEGEFDCLSLYAAGAPSVALGSVARISRFIQKLAQKKPKGLCLIALDNDNVGKAASARLEAGCRKYGIACRVIPSLSGQYKDPNEYLVNDPESFKKNVQQILANIRQES